MKARKFSILGLLRKLLPVRPAAPVRAASERRPAGGVAKPVAGLRIEPLEGRIAPATLLSPRVLTYTDPEGDLVTITFSADLFKLNSPTLANDLQKVFTFDHGAAHAGAANGTDDVPQQLQLINLTLAPRSGLGADSVNLADGISMTITATKQTVANVETGDGLAAIGAIRATGVPLGKVIIGGDLGQIDCGAGTAKVGLKRLEVQSMGKFGTATQASTATPELESRIVGRVVAIDVAGDVQGFINVLDASTGVTLTQRGTIDSITIGGALLGNPTVAAASDNTGRIECSYDILSATLGAITGGGGKNSGSIGAGHFLGPVTVLGKLKGGGGQDAGAIHTNGNLGAVVIKGGVEGGAGVRSGDVSALGKIASVTIGAEGAPANLAGGAGTNSGFLFSGKTMGPVTIYGDLVGGGSNAGAILATGKLSKLTLAGSLMGGAAAGSGTVEGLKTIGAVTVNGSVIGGDGLASGSITSAGALASVTVGGGLAGGKGVNSGSILAGQDPTSKVRDLGPVSIGDALVGGQGKNSGSVFAGGSIGAVVAGLDLAAGVPAMSGGSGFLSGAIFAGRGLESVQLARGILGGAGAGSASIQAHGKMGGVQVTGDVVGGIGYESAAILAHEIVDVATPVAGDIAKVIISGQLKGVALGAGDRAALIEADGRLGRAEIGSMEGSQGAFSAAIVSGAGLLPVSGSTTIIVAGLIEGANGAFSGGVRVEGSVKLFSAGSLNLAEVRVGADIESLKIMGDVADSVISARGQRSPGATSDVAIGSITINGNVSDSLIAAGYNEFGAEANADAQVGAVQVDGTWTASSLVAGISAGMDGLFGTADDAAVRGRDRAGVVSKIASVVIGGAVEGTVLGGDHFGFVAGKVGSFTSVAGALALTGAPDESFGLGTNGDVTLREITPA